MKLLDVLHGLGIRAVYGKFEKPQPLPYAVYYGEGQQHFFSDDTVRMKKNEYTLEYYFLTKESDREDQLENALLDNGFIYSKSDDVYIEDERVYVIYYTLWRKSNG